jgi:hypothetical protein
VLAEFQESPLQGLQDEGTGIVEVLEVEGHVDEEIKEAFPEA